MQNACIHVRIQPSQKIRGQTLSSMGESFFPPCTRHISMYLHPGIVILSEILSHGVLFLLVSSAITADVATADGTHAP
jgi:hypothetical protein